MPAYKNAVADVLSRIKQYILEEAPGAPQIDLERQGVLAACCPGENTKWLPC